MMSELIQKIFKETSLEKQFNHLQDAKNGK